MSDRFRSVDRQMPYLMPPSLEEWLPEDHLARFLVETVETLDTTALEKVFAAESVSGGTTSKDWGMSDMAARGQTVKSFPWNAAWKARLPIP